MCPLHCTLSTRIRVFACFHIHFTNNHSTVIWLLVLSLVYSAHVAFIMLIRLFSDLQTRSRDAKAFDPRNSIRISQTTTITSNSRMSIDDGKINFEEKCIHEEEFYPFDNTFTIIEEHKGIFRVRAGNQECCFTIDALDGSLAGRWLLIKFRRQYVRRIFVWSRRALSWNTNDEVFRLSEIPIEEGEVRRYFRLSGCCCGKPVVMWDDELMESIPGKLLLVCRWKWLSRRRSS